MMPSSVSAEGELVEALATRAWLFGGSLGSVYAGRGAEGGRMLPSSMSTKDEFVEECLTRARSLVSS